MGDDKPKASALDQLNELAGNYKGLLLLLAIAGGSGAGFDWLEPFSKTQTEEASQAARLGALEMEIDTLQSQVAVLTSETSGERQLREQGVNGNTLQINNLRNRISAVESRLLNGQP